jgi:uncharacterized protein (DUF4415 family)
MKRATTSKPLAFSPEQMAAALEDAPERINDPDCPYDPNDQAAVDAFWAQAKVRLPGQRGPQKAPVKVAVTVRYSPDVLEWFKATGDGWQTRMDEALRDYIAQHKAA